MTSCASHGLVPQRACVVGAGAIAEQHLPWLASTPLARLDTVVDTSAAMATYAVERFDGAHATTDLAAALARSPDVVHVLTPPASHRAIITQALVAGAHVICEKPLALDASAAADLLDEAQRCDRMLLENHNYRFNPSTQQLLADVRAGALGGVHEVEVRVTLGITEPGGRFNDPNLVSPLHDLPAGVIHDFITHMTYLPLLFVPNLRIDEVWARLSNHHAVEAFTYDDLDAVVIGTTADGPVHLRIRFDALTYPERLELVVRGSEGAAEIEFFQRRDARRVPRPWAGKLSAIADEAANAMGSARDASANLLAKLRGQTAYEGIPVLLEALYRAIANGDPPPITRDDILAASRLADRLLAAGTA